ncbi:MAG TPA: AI-2E family transporter [Ktedonobacterales bacterium]
MDMPGPSATQNEPGEASGIWARRRDVAWAILGWGTLIAAGLWLAGHILHTLVIVAIASLLAYALVPVATFLSRVMPRWLAITLVYVTLLVVLVGISSLIISSLIVQITGLAAQISSALSPSHPGGEAPLYSALLKLGLTNDQITAARNYATDQAAAAAGGLAPFLAGAVGAMFDIVIVIVLSIYLMADGREFGEWLRSGLPSAVRWRSALVTGTVERVAGGYIRGQMILCGSIALLVGVGMWVLGVPFAALLGVLAFFLEFIPFIGPPISAAIAVLLAWPMGWLTIGLVLGWFVIIHIVEGYVLQPRLVGHSVGVHPTILIIAALGAGEVFGLWGALFAAPLAGVAQSLIATFWRNWRLQHPEQFPTKTESVDAAPGDAEAEQTASEARPT